MICMTFFFFFFFNQTCVEVTEVENISCYWNNITFTSTLQHLYYYFCYSHITMIIALVVIDGLIAITFFKWQSATSAVSKSNCLSFFFFLINCLSHSLENYSRQRPRWKWDAYLAQKDVKGYWVSCIINFMHSNCLKNCLWKNSHTQKWYQSQFARWPP